MSIIGTWIKYSIQVFKLTSRNHLSLATATGIMKDHKDLEVWKLSMELVESIYKSIANFPKDENYGLTNQIRRSAVSIPSNISEGAARNTEKEFIQFLYVALGSASELETQIIIAHRLKYLENPNELLEKLTSVMKLINGLIRHYKNKQRAVPAVQKQVNEYER